METVCRTSEWAACKTEWKFARVCELTQQLKTKRIIWFKMKRSRWIKTYWRKRDKQTDKETKKAREWRLGRQEGSAIELEISSEVWKQEGKEVVGKRRGMKKEWKGRKKKSTKHCWRTEESNVPHASVLLSILINKFFHHPSHLPFYFVSCYISASTNLTVLEVAFFQWSLNCSS